MISRFPITAEAQRRQAKQCSCWARGHKPRLRSHERVPCVAAKTLRFVHTSCCNRRHVGFHALSAGLLCCITAQRSVSYFTRLLRSVKVSCPRRAIFNYATRGLAPVCCLKPELHLSSVTMHWPVLTTATFVIDVSKKPMDVQIACGTTVCPTEQVFARYPRDCRTS